MIKLPALPRVLNKREANWSTTAFRPWALKKFEYTAIFEVKHTHGKDSLAFSEVKASQVAKMIQIRHHKFLWKNPDTGEETPPDFFLLVKEPTFVVIKYPKGVAIIPIDVWCLESQRSKRRSLTWERAKDLSTIEFK